MNEPDEIADLAALEVLYGTPGRAARDKVATRLTPLYARWIAAARFCILSTVGPDGTDASPRGDDGPVVAPEDDRTLLMPDWRGNDRIDSLRNIVADGRLSLLLMVPGHPNVVRVNGRGTLWRDAARLGRFSDRGRAPRLVIRIEVAEVYVQCARAILRAELWGETPAPELPTVGDILDEQTRGELDGAAYDAAWPGRAARTMW